MKILLIAPQPFYQERGTCIAVSLLLKALSERGEEVDLLTYHEGEPRSFAGVRLHRIPSLFGIRNVPPGFSMKKVCCDVFLFMKAFNLVRRHRYDVIHAVEEGVFMAFALKIIFRVPYIYDMDSSMPEQLAGQYKFLNRAEGFFTFFVRNAVRNALAVATVCQTLMEQARVYGARNTFLIRDISLFSLYPVQEAVDFQRLLGAGIPVFLFTGNFASYQGISLLLESFQRAQRRGQKASLVIVGGSKRLVESYRHAARKHGMGANVYFLGHKPNCDLPGLMLGADVLVSSRLRGINTPMKIYSYLAAGKAILATRISAHAEVLDEDIAELCEPRPEAMADAMAKLIHDPLLRKTLGERAKKHSEGRHTYAKLKEAVNALYDFVKSEAGVRSEDRSR